MMHASQGAGVYGPASPSRLTPDEQRTAVTLWCFARSPLILGGRLPLDSGDSATLQLLTNREMLALHGCARGGGSPFPLDPTGSSQFAWATRPCRCPAQAVSPCVAVALFSASDDTSGATPGGATVSVSLASLGMLPILGGDGTTLCARDLWAHALCPNSAPNVSSHFGMPVPSHGAAAALLWRTGDAACATGDGVL